MRIAIDARKLHDFGIGTYIRNLLKHLALIDRDTEYVLLCRSQDVTVAEQLGPNFRAVVESSRPYSMAEQIMLPARLVALNVSLLHEPHYVLPPLVPCRAVVTIHDCIHLMFPQYLPNRLAYGYARASLWAAARRAERIFTVSETSKADILRYCDVEAERIIVVYNAIDDRFATPPEPEAIERVRERYQLHGPFALYVGNIKPHKNLERLIDAFDLVRRGGFERLELWTSTSCTSTCGSWGSWPTTRWPRSTAWPRCSSSRRSTRGSASRRWKRWRAAPRW